MKNCQSDTPMPVRAMADTIPVVTV
jgi:hypothetical protein